MMVVYLVKSTGILFILVYYNIIAYKQVDFCKYDLVDTRSTKSFKMEYEYT